MKVSRIVKAHTNIGTAEKRIERCLNVKLGRWDLILLKKRLVADKLVSQIFSLFDSCRL